MKFHNWLRNLRSSRTTRRHQRKHGPCGKPGAAARRPSLEALEDRCLLSFSPAVNYPVEASAYAVVAGDFNHDAIQDLAVANHASSSVSVLLGKGDGTFNPAISYASGSYPLSVAVGDFNRDGKLDLASANYYDVNVFLGNGDGTLQAPSSLAVPGNPQSVAVGDFNGDGTLDLGVTSNYHDFYYGSVGYADLLMGNGDGSFSGPAVTLLGSGTHTGATAANINGDGYDDFVTLNADNDRVNVLLGSSGPLQSPSSYAVGSVPISVAAADLNADGKTDLVTANYFGNSFSVLLGNGTGGFSSAGSHATGAYPASIALGDFNGDGTVDVATANAHADNLSVFYGLGNGAFSGAVNSAVGSGPFGAAAADFNGDGWLDAATANDYSGDVSVLINDRSWPPADAPSVSINDVTVTEGNSGTVNATFTLTLSAAYAAPVTVHYETADQSAAAGSDYTAASGDVTFAAGQTTAAVTISVTGDRLAEQNESFVVNLSSSDAFIADGQGTGTIIDDEPRVSIKDTTVVEGNTGSTNANFTLTLSSAYDTPVTVHYQTADGSAVAGSDYTAASGDVTFAAGQTTQTIPVAVLGDRLIESTESFSVYLSSSDAMVVDGYAVGRILDNEPRISITNVTKKEGSGGGTTQFVFTVSLSNAYDQPVTVSYATADGTATAGSDYVAQSGTLTFAPGETSKTITIAVYRDKKAESDETFFLDLFGNSNNSLISKQRGIGTILNDDR